MISQYFTEEHVLFRQTVRQFIEMEVVPHTDEWETERQIPKSIFRRMGELGYLGLPFPEANGGSGANFWYSVVFLEELARCGMGGFTTAVSVHTYMATNHLFRVGSEALKQKYLLSAIAGEAVAALGISEPDAGSDVAALRCTARLEQSGVAGDEYIVDGAKTFISNGMYGDFITLAVKTGETSAFTPQPPLGGASTPGLSLLLVELDSPGVTRTKLNKMGWHSSDTAEIRFDGVRVPVENRIGTEGAGFYYLMESLQLERLVAAILAVAGAQYALDLTLRYLHERRAFGKPLAKFQAIRHTLADVATEIAVAREFVYSTGWKHEKNQSVVQECSMAKLFASELQKRTVDTCLQYFGGYGYMEDYPICRAYRDVRVGTIAGGTSEIMREIIAKMVIDGVEYGAIRN